MAVRRNRATRVRQRQQTSVSRDNGPTRESACARRTWLIRAGISAYVIVLLVVPPTWLDPALRDVWLWPQVFLHRGIGALLDVCGVVKPSGFVRSGTYYIVTALLVPWLVCAVTGRGRPGDTGWRKPNRLLLRIVGLSFVFSVPFLAWMVRSPGFAPYYQKYLEQPGIVIITYYIVVLFCEHFFFEGVMLAAFRRTGRWPDPPRLFTDAAAAAPSRQRRVLQWFGLAQPVGSTTGLTRLTTWAGLPDGCVGVIVLSGTLFGMVHCGKAGREFLLAFPGGVFLAALAYRCNSWHAPYLLHAGTVTAAATMFLLFHR